MFPYVDLPIHQVRRLVNEMNTRIFHITTSGKRNSSKTISKMKIITIANSQINKFLPSFISVAPLIRDIEDQHDQHKEPEAKANRQPSVLDHNPEQLVRWRFDPTKETGRTIIDQRSFDKHCVVRQRLKTIHSMLRHQLVYDLLYVIRQDRLNRIACDKACNTILEFPQHLHATFGRYLFYDFWVNPHNIQNISEIQASRNSPYVTKPTNCMKSISLSQSTEVIKFRNNFSTLVIFVGIERRDDDVTVVQDQLIQVNHTTLSQILFNLSLHPIHQALTRWKPDTHHLS